MTSPAEQMDDWLAVGAPEKASSVQRLTHGLGIVSVLEVGCGTGAVLAELARQQVGHEYAGCEPSPALFEQARSRGYGVDVDLRCATFEESGFADRQWDVVVLSHVLEHTTAPAALVARVLGVARYLVIEVPLEGTWTGSIRSKVRRVLTGRARADNAAGHIQFFSAADIRRMVAWSGGAVMRSRTYFPTATYRQMSRDASRWRRCYYIAALVAHRAIGSRLMSHVYYGHFAVLATRRTPGDESAVPHPLYWHPDKP
jgi:SAM-dependent methyltransferase